MSAEFSSLEEIKNHKLRKSQSILNSFMDSNIEKDIVKGMRDKSKLTKKIITDKNGRKKTVWVKNGQEQPKSNGSKKSSSDSFKVMNFGESQTITTTPKGDNGVTVKIESSLDTTTHVLSPFEYSKRKKDGFKGFIGNHGFK